MTVKLLTKGLAAVAGFLSGGTAKSSLADADKFMISDSADSSIPKTVLFSVLKSQILGDTDALLYKGATDCSANPNYPAANAGDVYKVSVAGKIGGASGTDVTAGDMFICSVNSSAAGDQATVGANWNIIQANIDIDTDGTFAANSDAKVPSQKAAKTYADSLAATTSATFQIDSGNTGPQWSNNAGTMELLDSAGTSYADLTVKNLTVTGTVSMQGGDIGTAGAAGFGVGVCPTAELPTGMTPLSGYNVVGSSNYGNYQYSDGSIMVFVPKFYYRMHTWATNQITAATKDLCQDVKTALCKRGLNSKYCISTNCEVPPDINCKLENISAMVEASKKYGRMDN